MQRSSGVEYNANNYAKSSVGTGSGGSLEAKIGVRVTWPITGQVFSGSYYHDDGWQCDADQCGTAVPLGASFTTRLQQDGSFRAGTANFSLMYDLRTVSTSYSFHFAVQHGEGPLRPYGWFTKESTSGMNTTNLVRGQNTDGTWNFDPLFGMVWQYRGNDTYDFSYDLNFSGYTYGIDLGEELSITAYAYGAADSSSIPTTRSMRR